MMCSRNCCRADSVKQFMNGLSRVASLHVGGRLKVHVTCGKSLIVCLG